MRIFAFILIAAVVVGFSLGYVRLSQASSEDTHAVYVVKAGDTLWDIALRHAPLAMDIRDYVYRLRQVNGLKQSATIHPGQELKLPATR